MLQLTGHDGIPIYIRFAHISMIRETKFATKIILSNNREVIVRETPVEIADREDERVSHAAIH